MRNKKILIICTVTALVLITMGTASANAITVNNSTGPVADFSSIQAAVDAAVNGDTILVYKGFYKENVDVSQADIIIKSESGNPDDTIVQADNLDDHVFDVTADNVTISGFTVTGATSSTNAGIFLAGVLNNNVSNNKLSNNYNGIRLFSSSSNYLVSNTMTDNDYGIMLLFKSSSNLIYNNYFNNTNNLNVALSNKWNITKTEGTNIVGGPYLGGNYWATPAATGHSQICTDADNDGFCDSPYIINEYNIDHLPLKYKPNQPPIAKVNGPYVVDEGSSITFDAFSSSDPDGDTLEYRWDFNNDGIWDTEWLDSPTADYTLNDDNTRNIVVEVSDGVLTDIATAVVKVNNVEPNITSLTVQPTEPVGVGTKVDLTATFTDPGTLDTHNYTIDWGNGTITGPFSATSPVIANNTYTTPGVYTVKLNVTDDEDGFDTEVYQYVIVYDPYGEFVTGAGWIFSPEGAYTADPSLNGTAKFGFVSKYIKDEDVTTSNTVFKFHAGDLNFHSKNYDWLVVNNHKATYKGTGMINGEGNYGFMLSAIDAECTPSTDVDLFRIKIWDKDNNDAVVYDNMLGADEDADPTTAIQGGEIKVHAKK
ncbi:NosD domain-containing protein [Methanococcoides sp. FTZ1]|uniref:right-handed parallel beta-helix repeat-containing protein n=1 Tax=Methanococcoides sp. FTZ1 TaxID=3439061 RepID=UPI003F8619AD